MLYHFRFLKKRKYYFRFTYIDSLKFIISGFTIFLQYDAAFNSSKTVCVVLHLLLFHDTTAFAQCQILNKYFRNLQTMSVFGEKNFKFLLSYHGMRNVKSYLYVPLSYYRAHYSKLRTCFEAVLSDQAFAPLNLNLLC